MAQLFQGQNISFATSLKTKKPFPDLALQVSKLVAFSPLVMPIPVDFYKTTHFGVMSIHVVVSRGQTKTDKFTKHGHLKIYQQTSFRNPWLTTSCARNPHRQGASSKASVMINIFCRLPPDFTYTCSAPVLPGSPEIDNPNSFSLALKLISDVFFLSLLMLFNLGFFQSDRSGSWLICSNGLLHYCSARVIN